MDQQQMQQLQQQQEQKMQVEAMKEEMLGQILTPAAKERLGNIKMVKPEKAAQITNSLIQAAQSGKLKDKVKEKELIELLDNLTEQQKTTSSVTFTRRGLDDDDW